MDAIRFISKVLANEMEKLGQKQITLAQFNYLIDAFEAQKFVPEHDTFFPAVRELAAKVRKGEE